MCKINFKIDAQIKIRLDKIFDLRISNPFILLFFLKKKY